MDGGFEESMAVGLVSFDSLLYKMIHFYGGRQLGCITGTIAIGIGIAGVAAFVRVHWDEDGQMEKGPYIEN